MAYYASGDCSAMISVMKPRFSVSVFLFMLAGAFLLAGPDRLAAQNASGAAQIAASLPPESRAVIERRCV